MTATYENDPSVRELVLYIQNESKLWGPRSQGEAIRKNLEKKMAAGKYDPKLGAKAFEYLAESGAKEYVKDYGSPGDKYHQMFPADVRRGAAKFIADEWEEEASLSRNGSDGTGVEIEGRIWRDANGNSYHKTYITVVRGGEAAEYSSGIEYGYGNAYEDTAKDMLKQLGIIPNSFKGSLYSYFSKQGVSYKSGYEIVSRKKDM